MCVPDVCSRTCEAAPSLKAWPLLRRGLVGAWRVPGACAWGSPLGSWGLLHATSNQSQDTLLQPRGPGGTTPLLTALPFPYTLGCGGWGLLCHETQPRLCPVVWASCLSFPYPSLFLFLSDALYPRSLCLMTAPAHAQVRAHVRPPGFPAHLIAGNVGPLCFTCCAVLYCLTTITEVL